MIEKAIAIESHLLDSRSQALLRDRLADLFGRIEVAFALERLTQLWRQRRGCRDGLARLIGDDLRIYVMQRSVDAEPRLRIGSRHLAPNPILPGRAIYRSTKWHMP